MITEFLPVKLTETEVRERGEKLARLMGSIQEEEITKKSFDATAKARIEELSAEAREIAGVIRTRQENREVQVEEQKDYVRQECRTVRLDTMEVVHRRAMTPQELQRPLPIDGEVREESRA